ncbi:MAG: hypothetical protein RBU25_21210, partial [Lentisphaeria bacterium]|nr:hypothetical protein [Lentisphaeria bacterium]
VLWARLLAAAVLYRLCTAAPAVHETGGVNLGAMMAGGPGGGGMGGGGMGGPNPHRDLGQLVRKLALHASGEGNGLSPEQGAKLLPVLQALTTAEGMTAEEAEAKKAEIEALLTPEQTTALAALELPRPQRGGPGGPGGMAPPSEGGAPGGGDRRAAMRARMLETPYVKKLYDEKAAADPGFAADEEKQSEFFRSLRGQLNPFLSGPNQEALQQLASSLAIPQ